MEPIGSTDNQAVKTRLPPDAYLSRDYYDEEMERIFRPGWIAIVERMQSGRHSPVSSEIHFAGSWDYTQIAFQERVSSVMNDS